MELAFFIASFGDKFPGTKEVYLSPTSMFSFITRNYLYRCREKLELDGSNTEVVSFFDVINIIVNAINRKINKSNGLHDFFTAATAIITSWVYWNFEEENFEVLSYTENWTPSLFTKDIIDIISIALLKHCISEGLSLSEKAEIFRKRFVPICDSLEKDVSFIRFTLNKDEIASMGIWKMDKT